MKFKIGDKVMLKAVPYDNFNTMERAKSFYDNGKEVVFTITGIWNETCLLNFKFDVYAKYLKHAVKPKAVKYTIDCDNLECEFCSFHKNDSICKFEGTKKDVEQHINVYWKQPKIKEVK